MLSYQWKMITEVSWLSFRFLRQRRLWHLKAKIIRAHKWKCALQEQDWEFGCLPLSGHVWFSGPALRAVLFLMPGISFKWCPFHVCGTIINTRSLVFHTVHHCPHCSLLLSAASVMRPNTKGALGTEEDDPEKEWWQSIQLYKWAWKTTIQFPEAATGCIL